ncbi:hypothetical protein EDE08_11364 [Bradyrhizobium sp. R2.2-H]|nr:hypothetical protein EDE10_11364 [Bradyrhizobium sp. Y-H1]TCU67597.1 hypothetical protein EDE08_11364 [Bradyrhizobium sp. R2.2-H]
MRFSDDALCGLAIETRQADVEARPKLISAFIEKRSISVSIALFPGSTIFRLRAAISIAPSKQADQPAANNCSGLVPMPAPPGGDSTSPRFTTCVPRWTGVWRGGRRRHRHCARRRGSAIFLAISLLIEWLAIAPLLARRQRGGARGLEQEPWDRRGAPRRAEPAPAARRIHIRDLLDVIPGFEPPPRRRSLGAAHRDRGCEAIAPIIPRGLCRGLRNDRYHPVGVPCVHWPPAIFAAAMTAWVRLSTPSFCRMAETCALMVASETPSS